MQLAGLQLHTYIHQKSMDRGGTQDVVAEPHDGSFVHVVFVTRSFSHYKIVLILVEVQHLKLV